MQRKSMTMGACLAALALGALMMSVTSAAAGAGDTGISPTGSQQSEMNVSCNAQAADRKLSGAEKDSFIEKCVKDAVLRAPPGRVYLLQRQDSNSGAGANQSCEAQAAGQKLTGAEKDSFVEKCLKDQMQTGGPGTTPAKGNSPTKGN